MGVLVYNTWVYNVRTIMRSKYATRCNMVAITAISSFYDNYIWLMHASNQAWIIDPGDAQPVLQYLEAHPHIDLLGILLTHHHADHTGGVEKLLTHYDIPVYGPDAESIPMVTHPLNGGDTVSLPLGCFDVIAVPGHTLGHIAYYSKNVDQQPVLFVGDTLFSVGCGRIFEGTYEMMFDSLQKIKNLDHKTRIFCAHEYTMSNIAFALAVDCENAQLKQYKTKVESLRKKNLASVPSVLGWELDVNPFLRTDHTNIVKAVSQKCSQSFSSEIEIFAALRQWKDHF